MTPTNNPTDNSYSNRELDSKFTNLLEHMKGFENSVTGSLDRIEKQTVKTNGRVSNLEAWRNYVLGFCAAISLLLIPILFRVFDKAL